MESPRVQDTEIAGFDVALVTDHALRQVPARFLGGEFLARRPGGGLDRDSRTPSGQYLPLSPLILATHTCTATDRPSAGRLWCSSSFTGTKRMVGRVTASQMASATAASFFCRFTQGIT